MLGSSKTPVIAWVGVLAVMLVVSGRGASARADGCTNPQAATELAAGTPVQNSLPGSSSADLFVFEVTEADTVVTVTLGDPYERLLPRFDSSCEIDMIGGGRHVEREGWDRLGDAWVLSFDSAAYVGDYYVTVAADPQNTAYPASYVLGVEREE